MVLGSSSDGEYVNGMGLARWYRRLAPLLLVALVAPAAAAQEPAAPPAPAPAVDDESERLIALGVERRRAGDDQEALALFTRADAVRPSGHARAQMGLALQALGRWVEAERALTAVLPRRDDPWVERYRNLLESGLAAVQSHLAWLDVTCTTAGATLYVQGALAGALPLGEPLRVEAGRVVIEVSAPGYVTEHRERDVEGNARVREAFTLLPAQASQTRRMLAWVAAGTAGALLAGGVVAHALRETNAASYNDDSQCLYGNLTRYQRCGHYLDTSQTAQTVAIVGYSGAAVAAIASVVLFLLPPERPTSTARIVGCQLGAGFTCTGAF
jgi:hypothetical protein